MQGSIGRFLRAGALACICSLPGVVSAFAGGFDFAALCELARTSPAESGDSQDLPAFLRDLSYDQYRMIAFRSDRAIWRGQDTQFRLNLFHRGFLFRDRVHVNLMQGEDIQRLPYDAQWFEHPERLRLGDLPPGFGYAGLRVHFPLNHPSVFDEVIAFRRKSYFRTLSAGQAFGASARGLAIDIGLDQEERFPRFTEFWAVQPSGTSESLTLYGLLKGGGGAGAYEFIVYPGPVARVAVQARLYPRRSDLKWAIAPITSMFLRGEASSRPADDPRPEVHDSDGLLIAQDDEFVWRPLMPCAQRRISRFQVGKLRGFGLLQRDRKFQSYQDREAQYDRRPSIWVQPKADWAPGTVELLELPTTVEYLDNVNAYWVLTQPQIQGDELRLAYELSFYSGDPPEHRAMKATATRCTVSPQGQGHFVVDFEGERLDAVARDADVRAVITANDGDVSNVLCTRKEPGQCQVSFECTPKGTRPVELRGFLRAGEDSLSETWSIAWQPK